MCNKETVQKLFSSQLLSNPSPPLTLRAHISLRMLAIFEFQQLFMKRRYKSPVNKFINLIVNTLRMRDRSQDVSRGVYLNPRARRHKWGGGGGSISPSIILAFNFCSLTDYQKLWHSCSLFVKTSFAPNSVTSRLMTS